MKKMNTIIINSEEYENIGFIGEGGYAKVYKLKKNNKFYALKKILTIDLTEEQKKKVYEEAKILSKFNNEYIIKYYFSYSEKDYFNILMEYGGDTNLKKFISKQNGAYIKENTIKDIIIQVCNGLKEIHKLKLIHRDLTPENIFIDENNKIKIGDFGVSKKLDTYNKYARTNTGKYHYNAPEIEKDQKYDYKADIYSLGCIIYELFTLNEYYIDTKIDGKDGKIDTDKFNPKWQLLIESLLKKDYHERPNIEEVINRIALIADINNDEYLLKEYISFNNISNNEFFLQKQFSFWILLFLNINLKLIMITKKSKVNSEKLMLDLSIYIMKSSGILIISLANQYSLIIPGISQVLILLNFINNKENDNLIEILFLIRNFIKDAFFIKMIKFKFYLPLLSFNLSEAVANLVSYFIFLILNTKLDEGTSQNILIEIISILNLLSIVIFFIYSPKLNSIFEKNKSKKKDNKERLMQYIYNKIINIGIYFGFVYQFYKTPFLPSDLYFNKNYCELLLFLNAEISGRFDSMINRLFTGGKKRLKYFLILLYCLLSFIFPVFLILLTGFFNGLVFKNSFGKKNLNKFSIYSYILLLFPY